MVLSDQILNMIAQAACFALIERKSDGRLIMERAQVQKLLEVLEDTEEPKYVMAYVARQRGRKEIGNKTASALVNLLNTVSTKEEAKEALGLFKWFYEAGRDVPNIAQSLSRKCESISFIDLINTILSRSIRM